MMECCSEVHTECVSGIEVQAQHDSIMIQLHPALLLHGLPSTRHLMIASQ